MIIGPTGAGKTVLLNFLCAQSQKFRCRLFFFDKDRGAEIFIRAIRGRYMVPDIAKVSGFNPFQLSDNNENRSFLIENTNSGIFSQNLFWPNRKNSLAILIPTIFLRVRYIF